jgi:RNA polymerase sigma-70 factor (ECF subfamily)
MDLATLVTRCQAGDELAWESLVRRFQARIYGLAHHYLGNTDDARDVAQEVFVRIYEHIDTCDRERFLQWMMRIARNACIDALRRRRARPPAQDVPVDAADDLVAPEPGPDAVSEQRRRRRLLHRALQSMSVLSREMIVLKEMQGFRLEEIARMLDIPVGTAKSRSGRARAELAKRVLALSGEAGSRDPDRAGAEHGDPHG